MTIFRVGHATRSDGGVKRAKYAGLSGRKHDAHDQGRQKDSQSDIVGRKGQDALTNRSNQVPDNTKNSADHQDLPEIAAHATLGGGGCKNATSGIHDSFFRCKRRDCDTTAKGDVRAKHCAKRHMARDTRTLPHDFDHLSGDYQKSGEDERRQRPQGGAEQSATKCCDEVPKTKEFSYGFHGDASL